MNVVDPHPQPEPPDPGRPRRFVRVKREGLATLFAGDGRFDVVGFTTEGIVIRETMPDDVRDAELVFHFTGFGVAREVLVRESRPLVAADETVFNEVVVRTDEQLGAIIVELLKNADTLPGMLLANVAARPHGSAGVADRPRRRRETHRALAASIMLCAVGAFAWTGYDRLFVVDGYGLVTASAVDPIRAETSGVFYAYGAAGNRPMHRDELIGIIDSRPGKAISITSPCDCYLGDAALPSGTPVSKGEVVARVIKQDARVEITARMPLAELWAVSVGDVVDLFVPDAPSPISGRITEIERDKLAAVGARNDGTASGTQGVVHVIPDSEIGRSLVGSEVPIRIVRASRVVAGFIARGS